MKFKPAKRFFYSDTDYLNYEIAGDGAECLLFLHGFGCSLRNWDDVRPFLDAHRYTIYLIDFKGAGFSSKPKDTHYSIADQAAIIGAFIQAHNIRKYTLVGHSMGGGVALLLSRQFQKKPEYLPERLILIDTAAYQTEPPFFIRNLRLPLINNLILHLIGPRLRSRYILKRVFHRQEKITPSMIDRYTYLQRLKGYPHAIKQTAKNIVPKGLDTSTLSYEMLYSPTLIIWGRHDPVLPVSMGKRLAGEMPNASLHIVEDCGHNPHEEHPESVADLINAFVIKNP